MQKNLENARSDGDRQRLMEQMEQYERNLADQMRAEGEDQNSKLKEALEARRARRKGLRDKVAKEKHEKIKDNFVNNSGNKVNVNDNDE